MRTGIKPQPKKAEVILAISPPKQVKDLRKFLGMVQYYRDLWARCSKMLAPLTILVGECGHTKVTNSKKTMKHLWHWDEVHQKAFDDVKATIAKDVVLAYPKFEGNLRFTLMPHLNNLDRFSPRVTGHLCFSAGSCQQRNRNTA